MGDRDGDADLDPAAANAASNDVSILLNDGDGPFQAGVNYDVGLSPRSVCAADFDLDGDGDQEIVTANSMSNSIGMLMNLTYDSVCGDVNAGGTVYINEVVYLITFVFSGGPEPVPYEAGDSECSGSVDIGNVVTLVACILCGGPAPCDTDGDGTRDC